MTTNANPEVVTDGIRLLSAVIRDRSQTIFRGIRRDQLMGAEIQFYDFVAAHLQTHGMIPAFETVQVESARRMQGPTDARFVIANVGDTCSHYANQVSYRAGYNISIRLQQELVQAIQSRDIPRIVEIGRRLASEVGGQQAVTDVIPIQEVGQQVLNDILEAQMTVGATGVMTGYEPIDSDLMGLKGGELLILAGRPKMGKTYYMLAMVIHAWLSGKSVLFVSMEMSPKGLVSRISSILSRMNPRILRGSEISTAAYNRHADTIRGFDNLPPFNFVAGNFRKSPSDIERVLVNQPADYLGIDGGYLLQPNDRTQNSAKHEVLADVINDTKALLEDQHIPGFVTVQFNRMAAGSARSGRRANSSSGLDIEYLAGTDAFGQTATAVMGISKVREAEDRRRLKMLVARDADGSADMSLNFKFNPPDFSYIEDFVEEQAGGAAAGLAEAAAIELA